MAGREFEDEPAGAPESFMPPELEAEAGADDPPIDRPPGTGPEPPPTEDCDAPPVLFCPALLELLFWKLMIA